MGRRSGLAGAPFPRALGGCGWEFTHRQPHLVNRPHRPGEEHPHPRGFLP